MNSDVFTTLHNLAFEEPCPKCGVLIQKNGGCKHMVCGKCHFEFCWLCLGAYPGYVHLEQKYCPLRFTVLWGTVVLLTLLINVKLYYGTSLYFSIVNWLAYNLGATLVADFLASTLLFLLPLTDFVRRSWSPVHYYSSHRQRVENTKFYAACLAIACILGFHIRFIYLAAFTDDHPILWHLILCLKYEVLTILAAGCCFLL